MLVAPLYVTLCNPVDCSQPGSSAHGILQAGILEWVAVPSSRGFPDPGFKPESPALAGDSLPLSHQESPIVEILVLQSLTKNHIDFTQQFYFASQEF